MELLQRVLAEKKDLDIHKQLELEVRFSTGRGHQVISKAQHDSVIRKFVSGGYVMSAPANYLRVTRETGSRLEISGHSAIASYCRNDDPAPLLASKQAILVSKKKLGPPVDVGEYDFRVALSSEEIEHVGIDGWFDSNKFFRLIERVSLQSPSSPFRTDVSVTKQSQGSYHRTFGESGLEKASLRYEVELELMPLDIGVGTDFDTAQKVNVAMKRAIATTLSALQDSNYPITISHQRDAMNEYCMTTSPVFKNCKFIGPSSVSLQVDNIAPTNSNSRVPNIRTGYTVTDKADGMRKLLFINKEGLLYLIDNNLKIQFSGAKTGNKELYGTIIDGEHIQNGKEGRFINLYAAFDIYYLAGKPVYELPFVGAPNTNDGRLSLLSSAVDTLDVMDISGKAVTGLMRFTAKVFHVVDDDGLFNASSFVLDRGASLEYETDGLIFTPSDYAVGATKVGGKAVLAKTWPLSFKWKPPKFNTVDFLVSVVKSSANTPVVKNLFQKGLNTTESAQGTSYKTLVLKVGFDDAKHGYLDPCSTIRSSTRDDLNRLGKKQRAKYRAVQFFPTNPSDPNAGTANVALTTNGENGGVMLCEEGDVLEDNTVVEFSYDFSSEEGWRWKPLRVRHDKTAKLRAGKPSFGNAYHVANSNWHSIHNPVTTEMIRTGKAVGDELGTDDIYYSALSTKSQTKALRDFHNLWVKRRLIIAASPRNGTLIDLACGRGGDLPKWIAADLKFVYGLDLVDDNISNRLDGACARYLNYAKKMRRIPKALFGVGNATLNIRDGTGVSSGVDRSTNMAVFGIPTKGQLPNGVKEIFGLGRNGFDVCSLQFAIHYMFKNISMLNQCLRNIAEVTRVGGYFIGTCYDGSRVFNMLGSKELGQSVSRRVGDTTIWAMTKRYNNVSFPSSAASVGLGIDVYQETIGKTFREYLVNVQYLEESLEAYGFVPLTPGELEKADLPSSIGGFRLLYDQLMGTRGKTGQYGQAMQLAGGQMDISFLNSYFIFKKVRAVDAEAIARTRTGNNYEESSLQRKERDAMREAIESVQQDNNAKRFRYAETGKTVVLGSKEGV